MKRILAIIFLLFVFSVTLPSTVFSQNEDKLFPTDDAHVLADLSDPTDTSGLMRTNAGTFESIELLSAWNTTESQNAFVTVGYLKFDISQQKINNLEKAELKMLTREVTLSETPKNVVLLHVPNNNWKESDIIYLKRPTFSTTITSSSAIATPNTWYSWDVTELVKQNPAAELSVALTFEIAKDNTQDYVSFYSKEFQNKDYSPYLALYYKTDSAIPVYSDTNFFVTVVVSGLVGAAAASFITKSIISKRGRPSTNIKQPNTQSEKIQCNKCGKTLPKQFKYCPFCSTQVNP